MGIIVPPSPGHVGHDQPPTPVYAFGLASAVEEGTYLGIVVPPSPRQVGHDQHSRDPYHNQYHQSNSL